MMVHPSVPPVALRPFAPPGQARAGVVAMPICAKCPGCQTEYQLQDHLAGKTVACAKCGDAMYPEPAPVVSAFVSAPAMASPGPRPISDLAGRRPVKSNVGIGVGLIVLLVACGTLLVSAVMAALVGVVMHSAKAAMPDMLPNPADPPSIEQPVAVAPPIVEPPPLAPEKPPVKPVPVPPEEPAMAGAIPVETMQAIKVATVFIKADSPVGNASGSGFLVRIDGNAAFIVTNHHVVGPIKSEEPAMRPINPINPRLPRIPLPPHVVEAKPTLTVVFESGTPNEQSAPAEIVNDDANKDLAVLKVIGLRNVPKPLSCGPTPPLVETMPVYVFGYPFGKALAMGKGSVSSIRKDDRGNLHYIQLDGDLNPGNSGGPVVDSRGRLVGVAVAKIVQTNIGLAIPPEKLKLFLDGKPDDVRVEAPAPKPRPVREIKARGVGKVGSLTVTRSRPAGESKEVVFARWYYDASNTVSGTESKKQFVFIPGQAPAAEDEDHRKVAIEASLNDPDHKLQNVSIVVRSAEGFRAPEPPAEGGDWAPLPEAMATELNVEGATAKGEVEVPGKGDLFYFQMSFRNADGKLIYTEPKSFNVNLGKKAGKNRD
jgi:S1-C subfamily serine protease